MSYWNRKKAGRASTDSVARQLKKMASTHHHLQDDIDVVLDFLGEPDEFGFIEDDMFDSKPGRGGRDLGYGKGDGHRARRRLEKISEYSADVCDMLHDEDDLPGWIMDKIAVMNNNMVKIKHYLQDKID